MKITLKASDPLQQSVDCLVFFFFQDNLSEEINKFDSLFSSELKVHIKRENFSGTKNDTLIFSSKGKIAAYKIIVKGLGKIKDFNLTELAERVAETVKEMKKSKSVSGGMVVTDDFIKQFGGAKSIQSIVEAIELSAYEFNKYKSPDAKNKKREIEEMFIFLNPAKLKTAEEGLTLGIINSKATLYTRDLVNEPSQITTPTYLAKEALNLAKKSNGKIKVEIMEKEDAEKLGMNAFLGVAKGSDEPPKFIILKYKSEKPVRKLAIIGKGITFDSGGLSLKPPVHMETMKLDMAGAATVLGVFSALSELKPNADVIGLIAACENMPSGKALKPGDILKAFNGKTIEVLNTDAEGRLTLADVLSYTVSKIKPDEIIDFATLTGACMVALGQDYAGIFANNEKFLSALQVAAKESAEKIWPLPLPLEYKELNKSKIADIKNIGNGRYAGAITAALFLQEFVDETPWAHLDIAGPAFMENDTPLAAYGGSGFGVKLTLHYLSSY